MKIRTVAVILSVGALLGSVAAGAEERPMGFFVTSMGPGDGANLGGLKGADAHCAKLATVAGAGAAAWLSQRVPRMRALSAALILNVVITMLPDSPDVERVALGADGIVAGLRSGMLTIDMSTISPTMSKKNGS